MLDDGKKAGMYHAFSIAISTPFVVEKDVEWSLQCTSTKLIKL